MTAGAGAGPFVALVVGTATEIGKTWVAARLAERLRADGVRVAAAKPVQSFDLGVGPTDAEVLAAATGQAADAVCPPHRGYQVPMAPPMAADVLGRPRIELAELVAELAWPEGTEVLFVETVGGVRSPMAHDGDALELARLLGPDLVVLVADAGLGTINSVRLAVAAFGDWPTVVVLNRFDADDDLHARNRRWLADVDGFEVVVDVDGGADALHATTCNVGTVTRLAPVLLALGMVVGACSSSGPDTDGTVQSQSLVTADDAGSTTTSEGTAAPSEPSTAPVPEEVMLREVATVGSLSAMAVHPDSGDLVVAQRDGIVLVIDPATGAASRPIVDISADTVAQGERGLLGVAVAPDGAHLYLHYTNRDGDTRFDELPLDGTTVDVTGRRTVLGLEQPFPNHNGGQLSFGPDGYLYLGLGDGGAGGDPFGAGQDTDNLLGKILRIDPSDGDPYAVPDDNPFADGGGAAEVWSYGVRNPWRFSWDRETGDLWIGDVGQNRIEEVDRLPAVDGFDAGRGANLGWNGMEGFEHYEGGTEPENHTPPVFSYSHEEGCSITGGYVYRGEQLPFLDGVYIFGDYCTSELWGLRLGDGGAAVERLDLGISVGQNQLVSFGEDADGEVYVLTDDGTLYQLAPA